MMNIKKSVRFLSAVLGVVLLLQILCIAVSASSKTELYGRDVLSKMDNSTALLYAYDNIVEGVENSIGEINVYDGKNSISVNEINMVYDVYRRDHTEHFWLGNAYSYFQNSKTVTVLAPQYLYSGDELKTKKAEFEKAVEDILSGLDTSFTEFEKEDTNNDGRDQN